MYRRFLLASLTTLAITTLISCGTAESADSKTESEDKEETSAKKDSKETTSEEGPTSSIFASADEFKKSFNATSKELDFPYRIKNLKVEEGSVQNTFNYTFNNNLALIGSVNKSDESVKEVTMIGTGDGTPESGLNIMTMMATIIATTDPSLEPTERGQILEELRLLGDNKGDLTNLSEATERNGFRYFLNSTEEMGIWFGASKAKK